MNPIQQFSQSFAGAIYAPSIKDLFNEDKIIDNLNGIMQDVLSSLTHMPPLSSIDGIMPVYRLVRTISFSCLGIIVCYKGIKMLFSPDEIDNKEGRTLLSRMIYSAAFSTLSIKFIDVMIEFCNTLIKVMIANFSISSLIPKMKGAGLILALLLLLVELFVSVKILISFWMRMAELVFSGVISPVVFVLYINKEWSSYLKNWWKRVSVLVFTQVAQVALLIVYSVMINGLILNGTFNGICLAIATLFLVDKTPKILTGLMDTQNNVGSAIRTVKNTTNKVRHTKDTITKVTRIGRGK